MILKLSGSIVMMTFVVVVVAFVDLVAALVAE